KTGGPFAQSRVNVDVRALLDRNGRDGPNDAGSFEGESGTAGWRFLGLDVTRDYLNKTVKVVYKIQQGRPFYLRFLEVAGNLNTKDRVIRRLFSQLEGDLVDAEKVRDDLRRVRGTGFFDDQFARGAHPPPAVNYRTVEGEPDLVDIVVSVEEGRTINANLSGGVASDQGLVGIVSLSISNFDAQRLPRSFWGTFSEVYRKEAFVGDGETFGIDLSPGSQINYSRVFYQHPDIFRRHFDPVGVITEFQLRDRIFRSHDEGRTFARFAMTRAFAQGDWQASAGVRWQELKTRELDPGEFLPRTLLNSEGDETFVGLTGSVSVNKLDNRRLPRTGYSGRFTNTFYGRAFGSDSNLWKSELSFDRYFHLGRDPLSAAPGIYVGLGGGVAVPIDEPKGSVNYGERFFFGGARIGRGFRFRGIGPYEGSYALGGETYARSTLEYRFPLYAQTVPGTSRRREVFRGSLFVDSVVLDPSAYELDLEEARVSAGFALGLIDPFPVTFSFGWPLRAEPEDERQVFAFSLTFR
ncbi:MAG: BamA/TamA family outer membrane protein, partial [Planctomycetota bacterium]|nr:BamA/TamA family outer membrane protein [Planctomycetota bacterium]